MITTLSLPSGRRSTLRLAAASAALGAMLFVPPPAAGQEPVMPHFPNGTTVILIPAQSTLPLPDGRWPGLARTPEDALRAMDAELEFAFGERRSAADWVLPPALRHRLERNPTVKVHAERLAYSPLLEVIEDRRYIPEPLHGELRSMAALFDTRYLVVPVRLTVAAEPADTAPSVVSAYRARLLVAMIDIRRSDVLWLGEIAGDAGPADSGFLLATLAQRVAGALAP